MKMSNDIFEDRQAFNFYRSYYEVSLLLNEINRAEFINSILHYQFTGELLEPKNRDAAIMFKGQMHSLKKQVNGYAKGKETYPNGNPTKGTDKGKDKGSHKEVQEKEEVQVKGKEKEKEDIPQPTAFSMYRSLLDLGAEKTLINDWLKVRKTKKSTNTETALNGFLSQVEKSGKDLNSVLKICIENSWSGFKVSWLQNLEPEKKQKTRLTIF